MLAALCCWLLIPHSPVPGIRIVEASNISSRSYADTSAIAVKGVFVNPQFRAALQAIEQRSKVEELDEPEVVVVLGSDSGQVNRIYSGVKFTFFIKNK